MAVRIPAGEAPFVPGIRLKCGLLSARAMHKRIGLVAGRPVGQAIAFRGLAWVRESTAA
jgi:hypothetical protein